LHRRAKKKEHFYTHKKLQAQVRALSAPPLSSNSTNMPSAVSVPIPSPAFTLTFGGVDFRLDQQGLTSGSQVSFQNIEDGVIVNLQGFTGTLRVSPSSLPAVTSERLTTAKVEEEPASPDAATTAAKGASPKQQQLPFTKAQPKVKKSLDTKVCLRVICLFILYLLSNTYISLTDARRRVLQEHSREAAEGKG
jgi:hypothetical protein